MKAHPDLKHLPVISPSPHSPHSLDHFDRLVEVSDAIAIHAYQGGRHPGARGGWNVDVWIAKARAQSPDLPLWCTETGYNSAHHDGSPALDEEAEARYLPRLLLEYRRLGIDDVFDYRLIDRAGHRDHDWGMVDERHQPRWQFRSVEAMIDILEDDDRTFEPGTLRYELHGDLDDVRRMLFQKGDGRLYLVVWQEVHGYHKDEEDERGFHKRVEVSPRPLRLELATPCISAAVYRPHTDGATAIATHDDPATIELSVPDDLLIIELRPEDSLGFAPGDAGGGGAVAAESMAQWDDELFSRVAQKAEAGEVVAFDSSTMGRAEVVQVHGGDGPYMLDLYVRGAEMRIPARILTLADKRALAEAVVRSGIAADHALAAFYNLAAGDAAGARDHLAKAGDSGEAVRREFE